MKFIKDTLFKYWTKFDLVISGLGFISYAFDNLTPKYKLLFVFIGLTLGVFIKLIRQSYTYYQNYLRPIKVKGSARGEAAYQGLILIRIEPTEYLRQNILLTLYCKGTEVFQPICVLEVIRCEQDEDIIAVQLSPGTNELDISKYLNEESRLNSLFVRPLISNSEIEQFRTQILRP